MATAARVFCWSEKYSVNIAALDRQHAQLMDTIHELELALRVGEGGRRVEEILERLVNYAAEHFAAEESLMEQHNYPGLLPHRAKHEMFRQKIAALIDAYRAAKPGVPVSLLLFLQSWIKDHLLNTDRLYSAFLNARGVK